MLAEQLGKVKAGRVAHPPALIRIVSILSWGEAIPGTMQNVSQGGMQVRLPVAPELGRTNEIEVTDSQALFFLNGEALRLHLPSRSSDGNIRVPPVRIGTPTLILSITPLPTV